jgi:glycosyltransferase involved in cell wall biosynthesis
MARRVVRISPGIELTRDACDPVGADPPRIVFLGSFVHPPNVEAALRLARGILPAVRSRVPDARLEIVGDAPPRELERLAGRGLAVTGRVPDVRPYLETAAVVTAPLRLGGGMRVKVLEALAAGKAIVATPKALAGIGVRPGAHVLVGESDIELADALVELLADREHRAQMGSAARAWALENLGWERAVAAYSELYESLVAR